MRGSGGPRLLLQLFESRNAGIEPGLAPGRIADALHLPGLLVLPVEERRAVRAREKRKLAQRLDQRSVPTLAVEAGHRRHPARHALLVCRRRKAALPVALHQPVDQRRTRCEACKSVAAHKGFSEPGGDFEILDLFSQSLDGKLADSAPLLGWRSFR